MNIEFNNNIPIYIQLVEYLTKYIISGKYKIGDKLPSVREMAFSFRVNPNTMQKALQELENLKLIYTYRTNGKYVTKDKKIIDEYKFKYAEELTNKYINNMIKLGFSKNEILKIIGGIK